MNPLVLGPVRVHGEELVFHGALSRHVVSLVAHVNDLVRLADLPAFDKLPRFGQVFAVALRAAVVDPGGDLLLLFVFYLDWQLPNQ